MLGEFVDPSQHFQGGFSAGNECFGLLVLVLLEMAKTSPGFKMSYSAMIDKPDEIPPILCRKLLRAPEINQSGHSSTVAVSLL
jgi:hypothetical protein